MKPVKCLVLWAIIFSILPSSFALKNNNISAKTITQLEQIIRLIDTNHVHNIPEEKLIEYAINGILNNLDNHSYYYPPNSFTELHKYNAGEFQGIGIEAKVEKGAPIILGVIKSSPAAMVGLKAGDKILRINSEETSRLSQPEITQKLSGPLNSIATLRILRKNKLFTVSVVRKKVNINSVEYHFKRNNILYIKISSFYNNTAEALESALTKLQLAKKLTTTKGIILDLRGNPGGLAEQAVHIASLFVDKGIIAQVEPANNKHRIKYTAQESLLKINNKIPMAVLMDKNTASSSEILAGALQDHKRALLIGESSFGKGSVQAWIDLPNQGALNMTTALYYTPSGRLIENIGLMPDIYTTQCDQTLKSAKTKGSIHLKHLIEISCAILKNKTA